MHAIRVEQLGGPDVLLYEDLPIPEPGPGDLVVKTAASGVNFIDVYQRTGHYAVELPFTLGLEGAGTVQTVGKNVTEFKAGDRVAWASAQGSYAEYVIVPQSRAVPVPSAVDDTTAAAAMLQGMTAHYLSHTTYPIKNGDTVLIHAGAGGVGLLLTQMAKTRGARVITTVSTEQKAEISRAAGADHVILYTKTDFKDEARRLTDGQGVHCVYDSVAKTTFAQSVDALRPRGMLVLFGSSSGPVGPWEVDKLGPKGSLFLTRPTLWHYTADRSELLQRAGDVFAAIAAGTLKLRIEHVYPLAETARAHRDLERRMTTGKLLLTP